MQKITEQPGPYRHLEKQSTRELLTNINREDQKVALAVERCIPEITDLSTLRSAPRLSACRQSGS